MRALAATLTALQLLAGLADARSPQDPYLELKQKALLDSGQRHLDLGLWCRDQGLVPQATAELLLAVEASERRHPTANTVLYYMQSLDDGFWKKRVRKPSRQAIAAYEKRAARCREADLKDRLGLAGLAWKRKMTEIALEEYEALLRQRDGALDFDSRGRILLEGGTIPSEVAAKFRAEAIAINGRLYLRDDFLALLPDVESIHEVETETLRVRSPGGRTQVEDLHALGEALLPRLEEVFGTRPGRRLNLFVFPARATYEAYLEAAGRTGHKSVPGFAQRAAFTAVVCAEGQAPADLQALVLHELTHLYTFAVSRAVMPGWYVEGFAEQFGGQGTFRWNGSRLEVGQPMAAFRLEPLRERSRRFPLRELLAADPLQLFATDRERALRFYAQSWALVRWLRQEAEEKLRSRFAEWERLCYGAALGAQVGVPDSRNAAPAGELFQEMFGKDLEALERDFETWLDALVGA